jgi:serine phosphatase RsbU (regulator of sigma subunit)
MKAQTASEFLAGVHSVAPTVTQGVSIAPAGPQLTDALKTGEGRLLTAIATVNGHGHPLQYASDVLAALKKLTPA